METGFPECHHGPSWEHSGSLLCLQIWGCRREGTGGDITGVPLPTLQLSALSAGTRSWLQAPCTAKHTMPDSALLTSPRTCCPCPCPRGGGEGVLQQRQAPTFTEPSIFLRTAYPHTPGASSHTAPGGMRPSCHPCIPTGAAQRDRWLHLLGVGEMVTTGYGSPKDITQNSGFPNHVKLLALVAPLPSLQHGTTQQESHPKEFQVCPVDLVQQVPDRDPWPFPGV